MKKRIIDISILIIEGTPLLIYPFVLLANVMTLAGYRTGEESILFVSTIVLFMIFTTSYPLTYILCWIFYFKKSSRGYNRTRVLVIPLLHITISIMVGYFWSIL
jgi:hypothetical protein